MAKKAKGTLIIIGGGEDREDEKVILQEVAARARKGRIVLLTVATEYPEEVADTYRRAFGDLGINQIDVLDIRKRADAFDQSNVDLLKDAQVVFFTGGDQLRITSQTGDSPVYQSIVELHQRGGTIVGTSAGASVMSETMIITGTSDDSHRLLTLSMGPGLGLIHDIIIDQHFAQRGRIGRLIGAVAQNPRNLGIGIDEDTAIILEGQECFSVLGAGGVYVVDGTQVSYSNVSEGRRGDVLSCFDTRLHVLHQGQQFDVLKRRPITAGEELLEEIAVGSTSQTSGSNNGHS